MIQFVLKVVYYMSLAVLSL